LINGTAHDISYDFYMHGVDVTMYQRSSTYIMSTKNGWAVNFSGTYEEGGPPTEVADLIVQSLPKYASKLLEIRATAVVKELDR
jgi:cation diffusion facilitator CzcD-associated flavoprotein CzcO